MKAVYELPLTNSDSVINAARGQCMHLAYGWSNVVKAEKAISPPSTWFLPLTSVLRAQDKITAHKLSWLRDLFFRDH